MRRFDQNLIDIANEAVQALDVYKERGCAEEVVRKLAFFHGPCSIFRSLSAVDEGSKLEIAIADWELHVLIASGDQGKAFDAVYGYWHSLVHANYVPIP